MVSDTPHNFYMVSENRHGKRAVGQVVLSFAAHENLKDDIARAAKVTGFKTPSEYMRVKLAAQVRRDIAKAR
jgi:hypothetical protein